VGYLSSNLESERLEVVCHELRGSLLTVAQLRVLVNVPAPADDLCL
jgi:hypothetical protein